MSAADWRPTAPLEAARERARMLVATRDFFRRRTVLEVETPMLSRAAVSDPNIESVAVRLQADADRHYFLHTSPEYAMKRLLAAGWPDIYQVCKVFRDGECGPRHQPEFTMIEWYRRGMTLREMMAETAALVSALLGSAVPTAEPDYVSYPDAFREHAGVDPLTASLEDIVDACDADANLRRALGSRRDDWLDLLLTQRVATAFDPQRLTILHHYPASQAALARTCPDDARVADRFEVFMGELELANGYRELTDAAEQAARFARDLEVRRDQQRSTPPLDSRLLDALAAGLPDCCGVAVGLDRLLMLKRGTANLRDVQTFTVL